MSDEVLFAAFVPADAKLLLRVPQSQLLVDNPILATALSNIFPYLLFIDNFLEIVTWTNGDPYQNFLIVTAYSVLVFYWETLRLWVLPLLIAGVFSSVVWHTSSVLHDSKFGEKPTIDEVLLTLHNITVRFELLLRPAGHLHFTSKNYLVMLAGALAVTPLQVALSKALIHPQAYIWLLGTFILTYHSPWSFTARRLLWRSAYIRRAAFYLTGLDIKTARNDILLHKESAHATISRTHSPAPGEAEAAPLPNIVQMVNNFTTIRKVIVSPTQLKQTVRFDVLENERRWLGLGWSKFLLPNERASFCFEPLMQPAPDPLLEEDFNFPVFENDLYTYQWQWMDDKWELDLEFNRCRYKTGWVYYDSSWKGPGYEDGFSKYTRTRKWTRRAILLIDKQAEVLDEA